MNKSTFIIIGVVIVGALVYFFMAGKPAAVDEGLLGGGSPAVSATIGVEILSLLQQIKSLRIDATVFSSPAYQTLQDFSVPVLPQDVGRTNPFAPVR